MSYHINGDSNIMVDVQKRIETTDLVPSHLLSSNDLNKKMNQIKELRDIKRLINSANYLTE